MIYIKETSIKFIKEPLLSPFGFKGGYINELWQVLARISDGENTAVGVGVQSILWSDAEVFAEHTPDDGNMLMFSISEYALKLLTGKSFKNPIEAMDSIKQETLLFAKKITGRENLRETFVLNALVSIDNALWSLYAKSLKKQSLPELFPREFAPAFGYKHKKLCNIPLITYGLKENAIRELIEGGHFLLKIKIGSDPAGDKDPQKMLEWDKQRLSEIHEIAKDYKTEYTENGKLAYYLDANGRYDSLERLEDFLKHAENIGALESIVLLEEPFPENAEISVKDLPVRVAADESCHSLRDVEERLSLGFSAIALKPIAKTISESLKILLAAHEKNVPCFLADLTVPPIMVEINKSFAARVAPIPGIKIGAVESNGAQNYLHWNKLLSYHPLFGKDFVSPKNAIFELDEEFFNTFGGAFIDSSFYLNAFNS